MKAFALAMSATVRMKKDFVRIFSPSPKMFQRKPRLAMRGRVGIEDGFPFFEVLNSVPANHSSHGIARLAHIGPQQVKGGDHG
jgi:hypothetical protein